MELENAVEEEVKDGGCWVPVNPAKPIPSKHNSNFINYGTGSHVGLAENPQNFHNFLDLNALASEKENCCVDCEFGALNNDVRDHQNFEGANGEKGEFLVPGHPEGRHNFVGLDGASVKAPTQGIVGEKSAGNAFAKALVSSVIEKEAHKQTQSELVPLNKRKKHKPRPPKVDLDPETTRVWNKLMLTNGTEIPEVQKDNIDWEEKRKRMHGKVETFIAIMHHVQGNRRFSPWKRSVVDSVVGVFLTQNVSDHLSSFAFMSLAAKFPVRKDSEPKEYSACGETSIESDTKEPRTPEDKEQSYVHPTEQDMSYQFAENGERHVCSMGKAVACSMEDDKFSVTTKSTSFRELLQLEETKFLEQFYDHLEGNMLCQQRIREKQRDFLDRMVKDHGSFDLEWLRNVPPEKAKDYLLSVTGLGLKSVECLRLLTLHHVAFPVRFYCWLTPMSAGLRCVSGGFLWSHYPRMFIYIV